MLENELQDTSFCYYPSTTFVCVLCLLLLLDLGNISDATDVVMAESLKRIDCMWQPVCSALNDLNQQECEMLLQGILMFISQQPKCRLEDREVCMLDVLTVLQN